MEDQELYNDFLNGNEQSFEKIVEKYKNNLIYFICRYVKNKEIAEDLFQEVILYLLEHKEKYDCKYSLKTYLYTIAKSKSIDYIRHEGNMENIKDYDHIADVQMLEEIILSKERQQKIRKVMNKLPFDYQMVIYLTKIENLSYKETALIMEKSERQIKTLAHNAKKKLKQLLVKERVIEMKNNKIIKIISIMLIIGICLTGVVFAKEIVNFVKNLFGANSSEGVDIAVENGYTKKVETEDFQKADGIQISVDSFMMDDFNFAMNFNVSLDEKYDADYFYKHWFDFDDLMITDETGQIVFNSHGYQFETEEEMREKSYLGAYSFLPEKVGNNNLKVSLNATGNPKAFPKSKHLSIKLTRLKTMEMDEQSTKETTTYYEGDWNFEVDVPEEMYNRENIIYKVESCNDPSINTELIQATLSNTALKLYIPVITTDKIDDELLHTSNPSRISDLMALQKEYVETSDGKKFETSQRSDGDGGYSVTEDGKISDYRQTFNLTKYDATEAITIHLFTNKQEEIIINLKSTNL